MEVCVGSHGGHFEPGWSHIVVFSIAPEAVSGWAHPARKGGSRRTKHRRDDDDTEAMRKTMKFGLLFYDSETGRGETVYTTAGDLRWPWRNELFLSWTRSAGHTHVVAVPPPTTPQDELHGVPAGGYIFFYTSVTGHFELSKVSGNATPETVAKGQLPGQYTNVAVFDDPQHPDRKFLLCYERQSGRYTSLCVPEHLELCGDDNNQSCQDFLTGEFTAGWTEIVVKRPAPHRWVPRQDRDSAPASPSPPHASSETSPKGEAHRERRGKHRVFCYERGTGYAVFESFSNYTKAELERSLKVKAAKSVEASQDVTSASSKAGLSRLPSLDPHMWAAAQGSTSTATRIATDRSLKVASGVERNGGQAQDQSAKERTESLRSACRRKDLEVSRYKPNSVVVSVECGGKSCFLFYAHRANAPLPCSTQRNAQLIAAMNGTDIVKEAVPHAKNESGSEAGPVLGNDEQPSLTRKQSTLVDPSRYLFHQHIMSDREAWTVILPFPALPVVNATQVRYILCYSAKTGTWWACEIRAACTDYLDAAFRSKTRRHLTIETPGTMPTTPSSRSPEIYPGSARNCPRFRECDPAPHRERQSDTERPFTNSESASATGGDCSLNELPGPNTSSRLGPCENIAEHINWLGAPVIFFPLSENTIATATPSKKDNRTANDNRAAKEAGSDKSPRTRACLTTGRKDDRVRPAWRYPGVCGRDKYELWNALRKKRSLVCDNHQLDSEGPKNLPSSKRASTNTAIRSIMQLIASRGASPSGSDRNSCPNDLTSSCSQVRSNQNGICEEKGINRNEKGRSIQKEKGRGGVEVKLENGRTGVSFGESSRSGVEAILSDLGKKFGNRCDGRHAMLALYGMRSTDHVNSVVTLYRPEKAQNAASQCSSPPPPSRPASSYERRDKRQQDATLDRLAVPNDREGFQERGLAALAAQLERDLVRQRKRCPGHVPRSCRKFSDVLAQDQSVARLYTEEHRRLQAITRLRDQLCALPRTRWTGYPTPDPTPIILKLDDYIHRMYYQPVAAHSSALAAAASKWSPRSPETPPPSTRYRRLYEEGMASIAKKREVADLVRATPLCNSPRIPPEQVQEVVTRLYKVDPLR
ncbi:hypothetical protein DIPPA_54264 [Diplonema papillatum]|nr:hypothetical protein DIPPA_54264 [Diplonema papillatum]